MDISAIFGNPRTVRYGICHIWTFPPYLEIPYGTVPYGTVRDAIFGSQGSKVTFAPEPPRLYSHGLYGVLMFAAPLDNTANQEILFLKVISWLNPPSYTSLMSTTLFDRHLFPCKIQTVKYTATSNRIANQSHCAIPHSTNHSCKHLNTRYSTFHQSHDHFEPHWDQFTPDMLRTLFCTPVLMHLHSPRDRPL